MPIQSISFLTLSFFVSVFLTLAFSTYGQGVVDGVPKAIPKCDFSLDKAPAFRGFKLGMDEKKAAEIIGSEFKPYNSWPSGKSVYFNATGKPGFEGVVRVDMTSIEDKVNSIQLTYAPMWRTPQDFISHFIPQIDMPREYWVEPGNGRESAITCTDFTLRLQLLGRQGTVTLQDIAIDRKIALEKERSEEAQRKALKP